MEFLSEYIVKVVFPEEIFRKYNIQDGFAGPKKAPCTEMLSRYSARKKRFFIVHDSRAIEVL